MIYILDDGEYKKLHNRIIKLETKNRKMKKRFGKVIPIKEISAKKQFKKLKYEHVPLPIPVIRYRRTDDSGKYSYIEFCKVTKSATKYQRQYLDTGAQELPGRFTVEELEVINKLIQELGWE